VRWDEAYVAHVHTWTPSFSEPGCDFGNALLSKLPLIDVVKQELRCAPRPGSAGESCPEDRGRHFGKNWDGEERRHLICGTIEPARSARIRVCSTHISSEGNRTAQQTQFLADRARGIRIPAIVMGDFNARERSAAIRPMYAQFDEVDRDAASTSPVENPRQKIDHIFASPAIDVRSADVIRTRASDHLPLLAILRLPPPSRSAGDVAGGVRRDAPAPRGTP
jgi:endonuclease/exonuclease/phosphatase family metal-dependent hydrolase